MSRIRPDSFTSDYTACAEKETGRNDSIASDCALRNHYIIPPVYCHFSPDKKLMIDIPFRSCSFVEQSRVLRKIKTLYQAVYAVLYRVFIIVVFSIRAFPAVCSSALHRSAFLQSLRF